MKFRIALPILIVLAVTASCAPQPTPTPQLESQPSKAAPVYALDGDGPAAANPETFVLASGEIQLVEFFSYI